MSETVTMTLTDFLLARITEDELAAALAASRGVVWPGLANYAAEQTNPEVGLYLLFQCAPRRVLAECEAKRRILAAHIRAGRFASDYDDNEDWAVADSLRGVLSFLALPYADHPDYLEEWRP